MLKLQTSLPFHLEHRLVNKWGYSVDKRIDNFILFKKTYVSDKPNEGLNRTIRAFITDLNTNQKKVLERRCDNIVNFFPDPYAVSESVRARLRIAMQNANTTAEKQFILEYMDENFPMLEENK